MSRIFVLSGDTSFCREMIRIANGMGHQVRTISADRALTDVSGDCEVLVLDFLLRPDGVRQDLDEFLRLPDRPEVILVLSEHDPDLAEEAITRGVWDYFLKPPDEKRLKSSIQRAVQAVEKKKSDKHLILMRCGILGSSSAMRFCLKTVSACVRSDSNVHIYGETGTGKELFARAVHYNSTRKDLPFIPVDCASLPNNLVESILFGHEKGAFTTAEKKHAGLLRQAHGGTLFLDEVGELPLVVQKAFLRVLQERSFRPVGGTSEMFSNFRLVSATNKDLDRMVEQGLFRRDLLFRLRTVVLELPPLRGRHADIRELAHHYLIKIRRKLALKDKEISAETAEALTGYDWPGNVRELINTLEHAVIMSENDPVLHPEHLPRAVRIHRAREESSANRIMTPVTSAFQAAPDEHNLPKLKPYRLLALAELEKSYLSELLRLTGRDIPKACTVAGISRARLYVMLKKYGL